MAVTVTASLVGRDRDKIAFTFLGSETGTLTGIVLDLLDPNEDPFSESLDPITNTEIANIPSEELILTATDFGYLYSNFIDGVYKITATTSYSDADDEESIIYLLFNNNAVQSWVDLVEKTAFSGSWNSQAKKKVTTESREYIQAASEFYLLSRFSDAKSLLDHSIDISESA